MADSIPERDWKYMRSIHDEILASLCDRINIQSEVILKQGRNTPHKTYLDLYRHIQDSDNIIARCFNDWRRSTLQMKISALLENELLTDAHIQKLSREAQERLRALNELKDKRAQQGVAPYVAQSAPSGER